MINLFIVLIVGGTLGWLASIVFRHDAQEEILRDLIAGTAGALLAAFLIAPHLGGSIAQGVRPVTLIVAGLGALTLLGAVNLVRKGRAR